MSKIFKYELKRILVNKFFLGMLAIIAFVGWQTLINDVVLGIANTAPFSPWSFGYFLSRNMPLLIIGLLFLIHSFFSKKEEKVSWLIKATPMEQNKYMAVRYGAAIASYLLLCFWAIILGAGFCSFIFNFTSFQDFIIPSIITIIPAMLFFMGIGICVERIKPGLIYVVMAVAVLVAFLPLPYSLDLMGTQFFSTYPLELNALDPSFVMPMSVVLGKCAYSIVGILIMIFINKSVFFTAGNNKAT